MVTKQRSQEYTATRFASARYESSRNLRNIKTTVGSASGMGKTSGRAKEAHAVVKKPVTRNLFEHAVLICP
jgi:hypothetical protein